MKPFVEKHVIMKQNVSFIRITVSWSNPTQALAFFFLPSMNQSRTANTAIQVWTIVPRDVSSLLMVVMLQTVDN